MNDDGLKCKHPLMIGDSVLRKFMLNVSYANEISYNEQYEEMVNNLDDDFLEIITTSCPQIKF